MIRLRHVLVLCLAAACGPSSGDDDDGVDAPIGSPNQIAGGGVALDRIVEPFIRRGKRSNTYRVVARKDG